MKPEAYSTGNVAIATMLLTLGCKWWKNHNDQEIPCTVQYDLPMLNKLASRELPELRDMDIVDGTKLAHRKEKKGNVRYQFEWSELLQKLINSWNKHEKWIANANGSSEVMEFSEIEPEDAARLFCQWSKNRTLVANLWKGAVPDVVVYGDSKLEREPVVDERTGASGERSIRTGSFKVMSVNANSETRERMGI